MASSFPQPGEKLAQGLFPPPESREGKRHKKNFKSTLIVFAPTSHGGQSVWSPTCSSPSPSLPIPPAQSFRWWGRYWLWLDSRKNLLVLENGGFEIQNLRWCKSKVNLRPKAEDDFGSQNTSLMSLIAWVTPNSQAVSSMISCCCEL